MRSLCFVIIACAILGSCKSKNGIQPEPSGKFEVKLVDKDSIWDGPMEMIFDEVNDKVSGTAICNKYSADYTLANGGIKFTPAKSTKMLCPEGSTQEYRFLEALRNATTYQLKRGRLKLYKDEMLLLVAEK